VSTDPATTTATGLPLAAGAWPLDGMHSGVHFKVRHIGLTSVHGRFNRFDATLTVGETLADTRVEATLTTGWPGVSSARCQSWPVGRSWSTICRASAGLTRCARIITTDTRGRLVSVMSLLIASNRIVGINVLADADRLQRVSPLDR
jgi:hypothetical protein